MWEWLELETSNFACRFITRSIKEENKIMLKGSGRGHVTYFWNFGTLLYPGNEVVITQPWIELCYRNLVLRET